ncbi:flagellar hook-length control protein FliK [Aurantimonas marina]|uniref:flagellar hook-length control protein FliK n=1 Tax=Aurantimonas marina TaxID=2780508 RepID=UPI0038CC0B73
MTGPIPAHTDPQPLTPPRSTGREAGSQTPSGESFESTVDAMGKKGRDADVRRDGSSEVAGKDEQESEANVKRPYDLGQTGYDPDIASLLAGIDQTKRVGAGPESPAADQPKAERASTLTPLLTRHALRSSADTGSAQAQAMPDGARAIPDNRATMVLDRPNLVAKAFVVPQQAEVAIKALGGSVDGRPNPTRVDLVSMRTDFQPADTVALDGQVRSVGPTLTASGFGRFLASSDAQVDMKRTDWAEAPGETSSEADGQDDAVAMRRRDAPGAGIGERNTQIAGRSDRNSPDGKVANVNRTWAVEDPKIDPAVANDPAAGGRPARQVASAVTSALADIRPTPGTVADDGRLHLRAGGAALKTIQIQLQPEQLGKLDVTMRLVDGQLAVHLVASKAETALRLKDDAEGLKTLLSKAGFAVDDAAISIAVRDPATQRSPSASPSAHAGTGNEGRAGGGTAEDGAGRFEHRQSSRERREGGREQGQASATPAGSPAVQRNIDPSTYL